MLIRSDKKEMNLLLLQIMQIIGASFHKQTAKTINYLILEKKVRLFKHLLYEPHAYESMTQEEYTAKLADRIKTAHNKLRSPSYSCV